MNEDSRIKEVSSEQTSVEQATTHEMPLSENIGTMQEQSCLVMYHQDWFDKHFQNLDGDDLLLAEYNLCWTTFIQIRLENHASLRIYIRNFTEAKNGDKYPTKQGVTLTVPAWENFSRKLPDFSFYSSDDSVIANNQKIVMCLDQDCCFMQQLFN